MRDEQAKKKSPQALLRTKVSAFRGCCPDSREGRKCHRRISGQRKKRNRREISRVYSDTNRPTSQRSETMKTIREELQLPARRNFQGRK
jgi:hypothetical protein